MLPDALTLCTGLLVFLGLLSILSLPWSDADIERTESEFQRMMARILRR